ncbi:N-acetylmuramoyl-L-alanine amidase [Chlorella sorokiniana]|uniref:N-acetylmuramoyl-L-alanine amidase n=1 Tax=Chlorella sorokiniana TaxID=3076 RepID=A0A2P6U576_CHLSO|nr:N-acetylmuramoyl-L-alanine amidase [Chlorella sorokiniana]|eukprot:PRW61473.1 N-acetylmuramoyl-L-alanine amidase [Chlorella sorokiniana]
MVLLELGFHDTKCDMDWLNGNRAKIAESLTNTLANWKASGDEPKGWSFPTTVPQLAGTSAFDNYVKKIFNGFNTNAVPKQAGAYYDRAVKAGALPDRYKAATRDASVKLITADMQWTQTKIDTMKAPGALTPTPMWLLAMAGTAPSPTLKKDLGAALGHLAGKLLTYTFYWKQYQAAAATARASGTKFYVKCIPVPWMAPWHNSAGGYYSYQGTGDVFEWMNFDVPRFVFSDVTQGLAGVKAGSAGMQAGPYACAYFWFDRVRTFFEDMAGAGAGAKYSQYVSTVKVSWPTKVAATLPSQTFILTDTAVVVPDGSSQTYAGFPTLVSAPKSKCGSKDIYCPA